MTNASGPRHEIQPDNVLSVVFASVLVAASVIIVARATRNSLRQSTVTVLKNNSVRHRFPLIEKIPVSGNTCIFRFGLPSPDSVLGLPIGKHIMLSADILNPLSGEQPAEYVARQYTPISSDYSAKGYFELLIKIYRKNENPRFPEGGWMSQYIDSLPLGGSIDVRGPFGRIEYVGNGNFKIGSADSSISVSQVAMIAGGTGITPMYQLISHILHDEKGSLKLSLIFGNQHPEDILLRDQLEEMSRQCSDQFKLALTVDKVNEGQQWNGFVGHVSSDMIKASFPAPSVDLLILLCGPPGMVKAAETMLLELGYAKDRILAY